MSSTWRAIAWAEGLIVAGLALMGAAIAGSVRWCTIELGCDGESSSAGGIGWALVALALVAFLAAPFMAARASGRPRPGRTGALATVGFLLALAAAALAFAVLVDNVLPALVVALGVAGLIAVRPPSRGSLSIRIGILAALVALAGVLGAGEIRSDGAILAVALLTLPAIGFADTLSRRGSAL